MSRPQTHTPRPGDSRTYSCGKHFKRPSGLIQHIIIETRRNES